jgi:hypothetical protein
VYALDSNRLIRSSKKQAAGNTGIGVRKRRVTHKGFSVPTTNSPVLSLWRRWKEKGCTLSCKLPGSAPALMALNGAQRLNDWNWLLHR